MLEIKYLFSAYSIGAALLLLNICAYAKSETFRKENRDHLNSIRNRTIKQQPVKDPSAIHSEPEMQNRRSLRPTVQEQTSPSENKRSIPNQLNSFPRSDVQNPEVHESTLSGRIIKWSGNFIPSRSSINKGSQKLPLETKLFIFKGKIKSNGTPHFNLSPLSAKPFAVINSNKNGEFKTQLPPGEYTIFAEIEGGRLYRNSLDGDGFYSTTKIENGVNAIEDIIDSRDATF